MSARPESKGVYVATERDVELIQFWEQTDHIADLADHHFGGLSSLQLLFLIQVESSDQLPLFKKVLQRVSNHPTFSLDQLYQDFIASDDERPSALYLAVTNEQASNRMSLKAVSLLLEQFKESELCEGKLLDDLALLVKTVNTQAVVTLAAAVCKHYLSRSDEEQIALYEKTGGAAFFKALCGPDFTISLSDWFSMRFMRLCLLLPFDPLRSDIFTRRLLDQADYNCNNTRSIVAVVANLHRLQKQPGNSDLDMFDSLSKSLIELFNKYLSDPNSRDTWCTKTEDGLSSGNFLREFKESIMKLFLEEYKKPSHEHRIKISCIEQEFQTDKLFGSSNNPLRRLRSAVLGSVRYGDVRYEVSNFKILLGFPDLFKKLMLDDADFVSEYSFLLTELSDHFMNIVYEHVKEWSLEEQKRFFSIYLMRHKRGFDRGRCYQLFEGSKFMLVADAVKQCVADFFQSNKSLDMILPYPDLFKRFVLTEFDSGLWFARELWSIRGGGQKLSSENMWEICKHISNWSRKEQIDFLSHKVSWYYGMDGQQSRYIYTAFENAPSAELRDLVKEVAANLSTAGEKRGVASPSVVEGSMFQGSERSTNEDAHEGKKLRQESPGR